MPSRTHNDVEPRRESDFLELGLLFIVTGLTVVLVIASLIVVLTNESTIMSSEPLIFVSAAALSGLMALVFLFIRRVKRFITYR